jgi:hypothetical protein
MSRCSRRVCTTSKSSGAIGRPLAVRSVKAARTSLPAAGLSAGRKIIATGDCTATTGMNCGLVGSQNWIMLPP